MMRRIVTITKVTCYVTLVVTFLKLFNSLQLLATIKSDVSVKPVSVDVSHKKEHLLLR